MNRRTLLALLGLITALVFGAQTAVADDWTLTGTGTRVKTVAFLDVDVYSISHYIKGAAPAKSKQAVIDAEIEKKFVWKMLRDVDKEKIVTALRDAYAMNGYGDAGKIGTFVGAFSGELAEGASVTIRYDAAKQETSVKVGGGGNATVAGSDFMKATWSIWFGKIDQPKLGDQLISKL